MEDQYGMADLRQFISDRPFFPPPVRPPPELLPAHRNTWNPSQHYDTLMVQRGMHHEFPSDSTNSNACVTAAGFRGFEIEATAVQIGGGAASAASGDSCTARWPRQETLALLEIRSRLDPKFKEANQKGPLWDEVSRILSEEHGYQRSGKKCREKFENLYKYYKKTKDGKSGRQDGKHYRFFRQLEALYGENKNSASISETHFNGGSFQYSFQNKNTLPAYNQESFSGLKLSETTSLGLSNSSDSDTDLSDDTGINVGINRNNGHDYDDDTPKKKKRKGKNSWKAKIKDFIDSRMKKLMDKQEAWMEKMLRTIEHKEREKMTREEEWRKQDAARIEREHKFWASERAWMEARDATLMNALQKLAGQECRASPNEDFTGRSENQNDNSSETRTHSAKRGDFWPASEITRLIHLRSGMELKFRQSGIREEVLWDEISHKMACFGHDRTGLMCRNKWDSVNNYIMNKKRKENSRICGYNYQNNESICNQTGEAYSDTSERGIDNPVSLNGNTSEQGIDNPVSLNGNGNSPYNNYNGGNIATSDSCFRYFMGDGYGRIMD